MLTAMAARVGLMPALNRQQPIMDNAGPMMMGAGTGMPSRDSLQRPNDFLQQHMEENLTGPERDE